MSDFYVTLLNTASKDYFPRNQPTEFRCQLKKPLHFTTPFECALVEFTYKSGILANFGIITLHEEDFKQINIDVKIEYLDTSPVEDLIQSLNEQIRNKFVIELYNMMYFHSVTRSSVFNKINAKPTSKYSDAPIPNGQDKIISMIKESQYYTDLPIIRLNKSTNKITIQLKPNYKVKFDGVINEVLSLPKIIENKAQDRDEFFEFTYKPKNLRIVPLLFIYTDIVEYQLVGDEYAPLLRVNTIQNKVDENCNLNETLH